MNMKIIGRKGGSVKSERKLLASRENSKKPRRRKYSIILYSDEQKIIIALKDKMATYSFDGTKLKFLSGTKGGQFYVAARRYLLGLKKSGAI